MSFRDFVDNFQRLEICYLGPDSWSEDEERPHKWEGTLFEGGWKRRVNAGGCRNNMCKFLRFLYLFQFFFISVIISDAYSISIYLLPDT